MGGYSIPGLNRRVPPPPFRAGMGYLSIWTLDGLPPSHLDGIPPCQLDGVPPSHLDGLTPVTWMGYPHLGWGTPPPVEVWTEKQTENSTFPHPSDADGNKRLLGYGHTMVDTTLHFHPNFRLPLIG